MWLICTRIGEFRATFDATASVPVTTERPRTQPPRRTGCGATGTAGESGTDGRDSRSGGRRCGRAGRTVAQPCHGVSGGVQIVARPTGGATSTSLPRYSLTSQRRRGPSISSTLPFSVAFVQHPDANHDVVTRMPRPALFSSMAPTSSRTWLTPSTRVYFLTWTMVSPPTIGSRLRTTASTPSSPDRSVVQPSRPRASNSCRTKCSNSVGVIWGQVGP